MNNSTRVMMRVLIPALVLVFAAGTLRAQDPVEAAPNKCKVLIENEDSIVQAHLSQDSPFVDDDSDQTFVVRPSGIDDTDALNAAFEGGVAAGPGSTVRLLAGTYRVTRPILIRSFQGCWRGAGVGKTVIIVGGVGGAPFPVGDFSRDPGSPNDPPWKKSSVFFFTQRVGGAPTDLHLSGISFRVTGTSELWQQPGFPVTWNSIANLITLSEPRPGVATPVGGQARVDVSDVEVTGEIIAGLPFFPVIENLFDFINAQKTVSLNEKPFAVKLQVARSSFLLVDRVVLLIGLVDSQATIRNNVARRGSNAFNFIDLQRSSVVLSENDVQTQVFMFIQQVDPPLEPSSFQVDHNKIQTGFLTDFWPSDAIFVDDFGEEAFGQKSSNIKIEHNEFQQDTQPLFGLPTMDLDILIEGVDSDGLIVRHNEISGSFKQSAILLGADPTTVNKNALIQGNNLEDVKAGVASIWLGPGSSNNRVLNNHVTVLDQGTGNLIR